jgi:hypothetical protein
MLRQAGGTQVVSRLAPIKIYTPPPCISFLPGELPTYDIRDVYEYYGEGHNLSEMDAESGAL